MLMQYAAIFDGSENYIFRIKKIFSYFYSKQSSLLGTLRRFFITNIINLYNYEGRV